MVLIAVYIYFEFFFLDSSYKGATQRWSVGEYYVGMYKGGTSRGKC